MADKKKIISIEYYDHPTEMTDCEQMDMEGGFFIFVGEDGNKMRFINTKDVKCLTANVVTDDSESNIIN